MTGRSMFRVLRWVGLAAVAPVLWACNARNLEAPVLKPEATFGKTFQQSVNRNVDMLFLVDDSSSMRLSQANLERNFPTFMTTLKNAPQGLPNVHVAVISSDMGAGDGSVASCTADGGKNGIFQYTARGNCAATNLQPGATYISDSGGVKNYTGNIEDVFTCIAALGETGCGFEHQFASMLRSLGADGRPPPPKTRASSAPRRTWRSSSSPTRMTARPRPAFRCSTPAPTPTSRRSSARPRTIAATSSATSVRRWAPDPRWRAEQGRDRHDVATPTAPRTTPRATCSASAKPRARIKALKADPSQVIVAAITGPAGPYTVNWKAPSSADTSCGAASCPWPFIAHACTATDTSFADPSVRVSQFVSEFGANGLTLSICADNFAPSLQRIGELINASLQPPCIIGTVANKPGTQDPDCTVVSHTSNGLGTFVDSPVSACSANGGVAPCWQLAAGMCPGGGNGAGRQRLGRPERPDDDDSERDRQLRALHPGHDRRRARLPVVPAGSVD